MKSFSLIEVIIFVGILAMFFVTGMIVVVYSLQVMKVNQHKVIGTQYAEQLSTWIKTQKESDWNTFVSYYVPFTFCFNQSPIVQPSTPASDCASNDYSLGSPPLFKRNAVFTQNNPTQIQVDIKVEWKESGNTYTIPLSIILSRWE